MPSITTIAFLLGGTAALMALYGFGRFFSFSLMPRAAKIGATIFLALCAVAHFVILYAEDAFPEGVLGEWAPVTGLFVSMAFVFFFFAILRDLITLMRWGYRRAKNRPAPGRDLIALLIAAPFAVFGIFYSVTGTWNALSEPIVEEVKITIPRLPAELEGLRIVQLTDLHASPLFGKDRMAAITSIANAQNPDLTLITGDFADGSIERRAPDLAPLKNLTARYGVYGVSGNHEYLKSYPDLKALIESLGIRMIDNDAVTLDANGRKVTLLGVTDRTAYRFNLPSSDIEKAVAAASPDSLRILLDHQPHNAQKNSSRAYGIDLQLSGHTHGGQLSVFSGPAAAANGGFVRGFYQVNNMALYVSQGTGLWAGLPLRIGTWPEITVLTLTSGKAAQ